MDNNNFVIVVGRQFGSGGRRLASEIARRLGVDYYDKELLAEAARTLGYDTSIFSAADERRPSPLRSMWLHGFGMADPANVSAVSGEALFEAQSHVLHNIASERSCVIVGRASDYVLRDHPNLVSIFLHAPTAFRCANIMERGDCECMSRAADMARRRDRQREEFYNYFTGHKWGRADNYDLTVNASLFSPEALADFIMGYLKARGIGRQTSGSKV